MKLLTVVGNRPQFVKAAVLSKAIADRHQEVLLHTGQHHDAELSEVFFAELGLPRPKYFLGIHGGTNSSQLGRMVPAIAQLLEEEQPDAVVVYGDTNSTLAAALAAAQAQRSFTIRGTEGSTELGGFPVVHVEAGMRSGDWTMPEELNRVLCDQLAALLVCPTPGALDNLRGEGVIGRPGRMAEVCGDLMADLAVAAAPRAKEETTPLRRFGLKEGNYLFATVHRAGNVDDPARLEAVLALLEGLADQAPILLSLHPRTRRRLEESGLAGRLAAIANLTPTPPLPYLETACLVHHARAVVTDSGGLQKEAYLAGVRCLTLRAQTEWTETVAAGWNFLVDLSLERALSALQEPLPPTRPDLFGAGRAAAKTAALLDRFAQALEGEGGR